MRLLGKVFVKGLLTILPAALTAYILYWLGSAAENMIGKALSLALPSGWYVPGMGLVLTAVLVFAVGLLANAWIFRWLFEWAERRILNKVPLVKTIYSGLKDLTNLFRSTSQKKMNQVVLVAFSDRARLLGFVTREDIAGLPEAFRAGDEATVAVYVPMSYQLGGFTTFVARSAITPVDIPVEAAMRLVLTGAVASANAEPDFSEI